MTFEEYYNSVWKYYSGCEFVHIRLGQAFYNCLPNDIASQVAGTEFDPFYDDSIVGSFLIHVEPLFDAS